MLISRRARHLRPRRVERDAADESRERRVSSAARRARRKQARDPTPSGILGGCGRDRQQRLDAVRPSSSTVHGRIEAPRRECCLRRRRWGLPPRDQAMVVVRPRSGAMKPGIVDITDEPVPNVALPSPVRNAPWPKSAAWLSPIAPAIGMPSFKPAHAAVVAKTLARSRTCGSTAESHAEQRPRARRSMPGGSGRRAALRAALEASAGVHLTGGQAVQMSHAVDRAEPDVAPRPERACRAAIASSGRETSDRGAVR
jgi:hypothetical protein